MQFDLTRRLAAEALGTLILVMAVVGSGIMAEKLAGGNQAIALLCNTIATGAVLFVIITIFAPVSGAHFNPAVSLVMLLRGELDLPDDRRLCRRADRRRLHRRGARASDVRPRSDPARIDRADRDRAMGRRVHRHVRPDRDHPRLRPLQARRGGDRGRPLHHLGLLVHRLDLVRQSGGDHRAVARAIPSRHRPGAMRRASSSPSCSARSPRAVLFGWLFAAPRRGQEAAKAAQKRQSRILGFELDDAPLESIDRGGDILGEEHLRDVLRAVDVPGLDGEDDGLLGARLVTLGEEPGGQLPGRRRPRAPCPRSSRARRCGIIHEEDHGVRIVGEDCRW